MGVIHDYDQNQDNDGASLPPERRMGVADGPGGWNERSRFDQLQVRWLKANMELDELMSLGKRSDDEVKMIKEMFTKRRGLRDPDYALAPPSEKRTAEFVVALAKEENRRDGPVDDRTLDDDLERKERDTDEEGARRKRAKFSRPVPDNLQGVYAFPDELSGGIGKEPIPIPPEFITEFYFKVGPKTVLSKTLTESAPRTLNIKSVEEDPFVKGMWNIEVADADNFDAPVPKITINEDYDPHLFDMDGLYKMMVQELTAKKAPDWLIRRAEDLRLVQKTRHTEDGNIELMVGAGASALLLLLLFI